MKKLWTIFASLSLLFGILHLWNRDWIEAGWLLFQAGWLFAFPRETNTSKPLTVTLITISTIFICLSLYYGHR